MTRPRVLISAYACAPFRGSEHGTGWAVATAAAQDHDVWVMTRATNRPLIEKALQQTEIQGIKFVYYDLPRSLAFWRRGARGLQLYYYLWQLGAARLGRKLHTQMQFDIAHHVTFCKYWSPTAVATLGIPFAWGPVGGGETTPPALRSSLPPAARIKDKVRRVARSLGELDPQVRDAARRADVAIATTPETASRLRHLGCKRVVQRLQLSLHQSELDLLASRSPSRDPKERVTFICMGQLLEMKGIHLALEAFRQAATPKARLVIVGDGPAGTRLKRMAAKGALRERVEFRGWLPREQALEELKQADVFVQTSFHDSGSWVTLEAMAAGKPVLLLSTGGPAALVPKGAGMKVGVDDLGAAVSDLAEAMGKLASDACLRASLGAEGQRHAQSHYSADSLRRFLTETYSGLTADR